MGRGMKDNMGQMGQSKPDGHKGGYTGLTPEKYMEPIRESRRRGGDVHDSFGESLMTRHGSGKSHRDAEKGLICKADGGHINGLHLPKGTGMSHRQAEDMLICKKEGGRIEKKECSGGKMKDGGMMKDRDHDGMKSGGKWIQKTGISEHKGALHRMLGVPADKKIPEKKLQKAEHSKNPLERQRANFAERAKGFKH